MKLITVNIKLHHLAEVVVFNFLHCNVIHFFSHRPYCSTLWKKVNSQQVKSGNYTSPPCDRGATHSTLHSHEQKFCLLSPYYGRYL